MEKILIIDDNNDICVLLERFLTKQKYKTASAQRGEDGLLLLRRESYDLVICDFKLPDTDGLEMLRRIKVLSPATAVIIITGYSDVRIAVQALKYGAFDYVTKPLLPDEILYTIRGALDKKSTANTKTVSAAATEPEKTVTSKSVKAGRNDLAPNGKRFIFGKSRAAEQLQKHIELIAPTNMSVIISGETGTGKELFARALHSSSTRASAAFVPINCAAIPETLLESELFGYARGAFTGAAKGGKPGMFELANGGTLFLDEVGEVSAHLQVKLLRVLQEKRVRRVGSTKEVAVDVRIIAATNRNLEDMVADKIFREDLYYRLNVIPLLIPPLRERFEDVQLLGELFLRHFAEKLHNPVQGFSAAALQRLQDYNWPGNVRELKNIIERSVNLVDGTMVQPEHIFLGRLSGSQTAPPTVQFEKYQTLEERLAEVEVVILKETLRRFRSSRRMGAVLGLSHTAVLKKLRKYDFSLD